MPRLIHLNGPSRVGKSTLARRFADDRPGTLCLDIDVLVGLVGGWRTNFSAACALARAHGLALASHHLREGHDVVVPQLVTAFDQDRRFERAAADAGARYVEVALLVDLAENSRRLREKEPLSDVEAAIQSSLDTGDLPQRIRSHLAEYLEQRPGTIRLDTTGQSVEQTYARLLELLDE